MTKLARGMGLSMIAGTVAVIVIAAFLWLGPGVESFSKPAAAAGLYDEQRVIDVYERVSPAVVEVNIQQGSGRNLLPIGSGSGFLIDTEGHIVTNNHVVEYAENVRVKFSSGVSAEATILGRNPANDLALLKVDASVVEGIQPVELGDSSTLKPGQMAIAIGNPLGLAGSVTVGVISQLERSFPSELGRPISNVIQTDALINPGNSGGPLLDSSGAVVGINTALQVSPLGQAVRGIGFTVPVNTLKNVLPKLKSEGLVRPPWLGVQAGDIDAQLAERLELPVDRGVYVIGVMPNSPAEEAGLVESGFDSSGMAAGGGDVITEVDGVIVDSTAELITQLNAHEPGDEISLTVIRGDATFEVVAKLGEWPENEAVRERQRFEGSPRPDVPYSPGEPFRRFSPRPRDNGHDSPGHHDHRLCPEPYSK